MINSTYPEIVAFKNMVAVANLSAGVDYAVYDYFMPSNTPVQFPCFILDFDSEIHYGINVASGSIKVGCYIEMDDTLSTHDNSVQFANDIRNYVQILHFLPLNLQGRIVNPRYQLAPGSSPPSEAQIVAGTPTMMTYFLVEWGLND
jgi:hypothetical protein